MVGNGHRDNNTQLANAEETLLNPPSARESDRKAYIRTWLLELGIPASAI